MKYDIFVSYQRANREFVAQVVRRLEAAGIVAWYDANIDGGADWRETIVAALEASDMLVIFFSEDCNNSRQLKKELAVADSLNKPVVPILLEDTRPRGAYLYELADRNWIQAWPDPVSKIEELVGHLKALTSKAPAAPATQAPQSTGLADNGPLADDGRASAIAMAAGPASARSPIPTPAADAFAAASPGAAADMASAEAAGRPSDAYVGKLGQKKKSAPMRDILPFKWIDLPILVVLTGIVGWWFAKEAHSGGPDLPPTKFAVTIGACFLLMAGLFGAVVFPVRYYLRRRPVEVALFKYLISSLILYVVLIGCITGAWMAGQWPGVAPSSLAVSTSVIWAGFAVIAFLIYGVLGAQRALRSFRANIKKL